MEKEVKTKLKSAKQISKEKLQELKDKNVEVSSSVSSTHSSYGQTLQSEEQIEDADVFVPDCQTDSEPSDLSQDVKLADKFSDMLLANLSVRDFGTIFETALNTILDNRNKAHEKAEKERIEKEQAAGVKYCTLEELSLQCTGFMEAIVKSYNLYANHKSSIDQQQRKIEEALKGQKNDLNGLATIIGRIENVQGVKAPKRPPFPSWACLTYLFWHWPMYGFSYLWLSKYFRRFCFLLSFLVMIMEFCFIVLLVGDNKTLHQDHNKYVIVRNWSYVLNDTAAVNRFNRVDLLFEDVKFNREQIDELDEFIRTKHEQNQERLK